MRVLVAMSGGVDSAVACALLARQGHEVVGVTLHLADLSRVGLGVSRCCSLADVENARAVCHKLGVPHYVLDMEGEFRREVLEFFVEGYLGGRTPSPCVRCNSRVKFGQLVKLAATFGADVVASGHYARVALDEAGRPHLYRGLDREKDQSYFLFDLTPEQLAKMRFPLGNMTKAEVRKLATAWGLPNATKPDSQEVCFVPEGKRYVDVLRALAPERLPGAGEIVDTAGRVLGRHPGFVRFTVGQRRGLGLASGERLYVLKVDPVGNRVVVGPGDALYRQHVEVGEVNWLVPPAQRLEAHVQVRSRHQPQRAVLSVDGNQVRVAFFEPVLAPTPGQAAVFYAGDEVLGGGFILRAWDGEKDPDSPRHMGDSGGCPGP